MKKSISLLLSLVLIFSLFSAMLITTSATTTDEFPITTINKDWTMTEISVLDNSHFTGGLNYQRTDNLTMSAAAEEGKLGGSMTVYNTSSFDDKVFTYGSEEGTLKTWISQGGHYRFWIKTPDNGGETLKLRVHFKAYNSSGNNTINSDIEVVADGKWHEVIADFTGWSATDRENLYAQVSNTDKTDFSVALYNRSTKEITKSDLQLSHIEFHYSKPTALGDGNIEIPSEPLSTINNYTDMKKITVYDNDNFTEGLYFYKNDTETLSNGGGMLVYTTNGFDDKVFTYGSEEGTLKTWIEADGHYRFWIKTPAYGGETLKLRVHFRAYNTSGNHTVNSDIEVVADGKWHEVIADFTQATDKEVANLYAQVSNTDKTDCDIYIYNKCDRVITKSDLQFSQFEFYTSKPEVKGDGHIDISKVAVLNNICDAATQTYKLNQDNAIMYRTMVACDDLPFFDKANTYKTDDTYVANNGSVTKGLLKINTTAVYDYVSNNDAELRFWVRTATTKSFALNFVIRNNEGKDASIVLMHKYPITVEGKEGWQEVVVPRSWFQDNPSDAFIAASKQSDCQYVQFGFTVLGSETNAYKANTDYQTFTSNDCIEFSNVIEMYSNKAYDKGDANCDGVTDIRDLVHTKLQSAETTANVGNCDIDNDSAVGDTDLTYMRNYLLKGAW